MSYYHDERERHKAWDDDWLPESERERWQAQRRRQQMTPGQTSYGGPARPPEGYSEQYGARRYPEWPSGRDYESRYGSPDANRDGIGYGRREDGRYGRREDGRELGRSSDSYGSSLRYGLNGGYGRGHAAEWGDPQMRRDSVYTERQRRESAERPREPHESARSGDHDPYFSELRSDTRYRTAPSEDWDEGQRYGRSYGRESARRRGGEADDDRDHEHEDRGVLYNVGRRIGEAVGDLFGRHERYRYQEHESYAGPRGYQRSDDSIRDQICERLSWARRVDVSDVSVDVSNGVVSLSGTVRDRGQKYYIEEVADDTYGVIEVNNDIRVRRESTGVIGNTGSPGSIRDA
ncbi:hypothetical protein OR16_03982 [Cupriavidus basilensis OR16]|uniref:BON domain-containing protein n=1 Tax=Cupriavidus basilensis OR16 TaxID=1127483 RepID=H1RZP7_9BURK|nr:BON domain-containing protein [Cupriavidus basilensis]EHP44113.1 hypothetical protein OR16_03982 [Cupriavidus basilensis OR16]